MGRIFEVRKSSMFARYDRMAKQFSRVGKEIAIAVKKGGPEPDTNPMLRRVMQNAKSFNMPKDRIEAAIKKATNPQQGDDYEEVRYECYAPGGVALIVEALTDNRNRTSGEVKSILTKNGGTLAESGSVSYMFDRIGEVAFDIKVTSADEMLEQAISFGALDCESADGIHMITCNDLDFYHIRNELSAKFGEPVHAEIVWRPQNVIEIEKGERADKLRKLVEMLDANDDIQNVSHNFQVLD